MLDFCHECFGFLFVGVYSRTAIDKPDSFWNLALTILFLDYVTPDLDPKFLKIKNELPLNASSLYF